MVISARSVRLAKDVQAFKLYQIHGSQGARMQGLSGQRISCAGTVPGPFAVFGVATHLPAYSRMHPHHPLVTGLSG